MDLRVLCRHLGRFVASLGVAFVPSMAWAAWGGEWRALAAFLGSLFLSLFVGGLLAFFGRRASRPMYQREALGLVGLGWLIAAGIGAAPFTLAGVLGPVDAYFETMSGFTTTGSSVLTDIEGTYRSILFWRSFTHWLGGMGIVVLFIAVLPYLGAGGKQLFRSEAPGPDPRGLRPRIRETASILWKIYLGFTVVQTVFLIAAGMSLFDALCHTFATLGTGGFSTRQASIAAYDNLAIEIIIIIFMYLAGMNFVLFFGMLHGNWSTSFRDTEWRAYTAILVLASLAITFNLLGLQGKTRETPAASQAGAQSYTPSTGDASQAYTFGRALRAASFSTVSVMTTTGFCTDDFDKWPHFSRMLLIMLMFVGGCAGSTGGGLKVVRVVLLAKMAYLWLQTAFRPHTVRTLRISGAVVNHDMQKTLYSFFSLYIAVFAIATLVMCALGLNFESASSAVAATLNNIGPGLNLVGPATDFHLVPAAGKVVLSLCMVLGRLELVCIAVLFMPSFWKHS